MPLDPAEDLEVDLPRVRDPRKPIVGKIRIEVQNEIRRSVRKHGTFEIACEAAGISLELLEAWMLDDPHLEAKLLKDRADFKAELAVEARNGDSPAMRKMALELLGRLDKAWAPRSRTTLASQLQDALDELKRVMAPEHYQTVIRVFSKHA